MEQSIANLKKLGLFIALVIWDIPFFLTHGQRLHEFNYNDQWMGVVLALPILAIVYQLAISYKTIGILKELKSKKNPILFILFIIVVRFITVISGYDGTDMLLSIVGQLAVLYLLLSDDAANE